MGRDLLFRELAFVLDTPATRIDDLCGHNETPSQEYQQYLQAVSEANRVNFEINQEPALVYGLPFAPEPPFGSYWPLMTKREPIISFKTVDNKYAGKADRSFGAARVNNERRHVGIDLFADHRDPVVACEKGKVINFYHFHHGSWCLIVEHEGKVINYGEIDKDLPKNVFVGATVEAGQLIGYVGKMTGGSSMLHFEMYRVGTKKNIQWKTGIKPSQNILNPTKYLLFLATNGLRSVKGNGTAYSPPTNNASSVTKSVAANRKYATSLGWNKYINQINDLLLPYSGQSNVSLSEENFVEALSVWQRNQGVEADGVLGPKTWEIVKKLLTGTMNTPNSSNTSTSQNAVRYNLANYTKWQPYEYGIYKLVGFTDVTPSPELFAESLMKWQRSKQLTADGKLGPKTFAMLQKALGVTASTSSNSTTVPTPSSSKVPSGFNVVKRGNPKKERGLSKYATVSLTAKLLDMKNRNIIQLTADEINLFQRIANVETSGMIQGINTWDSAVISSGFMQFTLQHGKMQEWIEKARSAYKAYGIEVDNSNKYKWGEKNTQSGIKGATKEELRWGSWAQKFYDAGLDEQIISAEVELARDYLRRHLRGLELYLKKTSPNYFPFFKNFYDRSPYLRGMFQAGYNNLPAATRIGTKHAVETAIKKGITTVDDFIKVYQEGLHVGYAALNDPEGPKRIIANTLKAA